MMKKDDPMPLWLRLFCPPGWLLMLLTAASAAGLVFAFIKQRTETPAACALYALSFYTLCTVTLRLVKNLPGWRQALRRRAESSSFCRRYAAEPAFRTRVSLYITLAVSLLYVGVNLLSWVLYRSLWYIVLAVYYGILAVMRFLLVRYVRGTDIGDDFLKELHRARLCACILLLVNFALSGAVLMILYQDKGVEYRGVLIYAMAAYTFYAVIHAAVDLAKYRRYKSPVMTAAKVIALSAALVSLLNLETAMFAAFGAGMPLQERRLMIMLTGAGVSAAVVVMSVYMILRTAQQIREINQNGRE